MAVQLARSYHVERGEPRAVAGDLAGAGLPRADDGDARPDRPARAASGRSGPTCREHLHIPPSTWRFDPTGEAALAALDRALEEAGPENVSAFFCEAISAAALPAYTPPDGSGKAWPSGATATASWSASTRSSPASGRTGRWFAGAGTACAPDIIATAKGLGAGYAAIGAVLCREHVYQAVANGSRRFPLGHTWDGAPLSCAVGLAVLERLRSEGLIERVRERGPRLRDELAAALDGIPLVREVRGTASCSGSSTSTRATACRSCRPSSGWPAGSTRPRSSAGSITLSTQPTRDGYAGDQTLFAPPFTTTDDELARDGRRGSPTRFGGSPMRSRRSCPAPAPIGGERVSAARLRALILQHEEPTPPGLVGGWLDEHGAEVDELRIDVDERE